MTEGIRTKKWLCEVDKVLASGCVRCFRHGDDGLMLFDAGKFPDDVSFFEFITEFERINGSLATAAEILGKTDKTK